MVFEVSAVFKKTSPNQRISLYLPSRDYCDIREAIDGVAQVDISYLKGRKVFAQLVMHCRYGREKDEVMGLKFYKDFCLSSSQVYPRVEQEYNLSKMQASLIEKLGSHCSFPITFHFTEESPNSVMLQSGGKSDKSEPCGIHYYIQVFVEYDEMNRPHRRNTAKLEIRKMQLVSCELIKEILKGQPHVVARQNFMICSGDVELEACLDKKIYEVGEQIPINVCIQNNSTKFVKKVKVMLYQNVQIKMLATGKYKRVIDEHTSRKGCPVEPGASLQTVLYVTPSILGNRLKHGLALDANHNTELIELACSTVTAKKKLKEEFGIVVSYFIRVKLYLNLMHREISALLPFTLIQDEKNIDVYVD